MISSDWTDTMLATIEQIFSLLNAWDVTLVPASYCEPGLTLSRTVTSSKKELPAPNYTIIRSQLFFTRHPAGSVSCDV